MSNTKTDEDKNVSYVTTWPDVRLLDEWDDDCKAKFGNCRWMKMWNDHMSSKRESVINEIREELEMLKKRIYELEQKPEEEIQTLGGE